MRLIFIKILNCADCIEKTTFQALWKTKSPKRVNILIWIKIFGTLGCLATLQSKLQGISISLSICPLCLANGQDLQHFSFDCPFSVKCCQKIFYIFQVSWVFPSSFKESVLQIVNGPELPPKHKSMVKRSKNNTI